MTFMFMMSKCKLAWSFWIEDEYEDNSMYSNRLEYDALTVMYNVTKFF